MNPMKSSSFHPILGKCRRRDFEVAVTRALLEKALGAEEARDVMETSGANNLSAEASTLLFSFVESEVSGQIVTYQARFILGLG